MVGQSAAVSEVGDFMVLDVKVIGGQPGQREQTETGQRGNDLVPVNEPGQRKAEFGEFRVVSANAAHGNESNAFHGSRDA